MSGVLTVLGGALALRPKALSPPAESRGGWWPVIREPFAGAWQRNITIDTNQVLSNSTVFSCLSRVASDIAKLRSTVIQLTADGIWLEKDNPAYSPVLRQPNPYQNDIQFKETWVLCKLIHGNTYALKKRDNASVVRGLYLLDPLTTKPLVADDGSVFYQLRADNLSAVSGPIIVPAREIIHDRWNCLYHPLVGISPLFASGLAATQGLNIQTHSALFFANNSQPGGILTAPGNIPPDVAERLKEHWEENFGGNNVGKVAVLGSGLTFEQLAMTAVQSELIDQLTLTAEMVCSTLHVPRFMVGVGPYPTYDNVEAQLSIYYSQCLQTHIESFERCIGDGLGMGSSVGVQLDIGGLLRMDTAAQYKANSEGVRGGWLAPNEARRKVELRPVLGGDVPFLQHQDYPIDMLADRGRPAPGSNGPAQSPASPPPTAPTKDGGDGRNRRRSANTILRRAGLGRLAAA